MNVNVKCTGGTIQHYTQTHIQEKEQRFYFSMVKEEFEDIEGVIRIRKSKKNTIQLSKEKGQKDKP
jgi:23S rRNA pseudoU1915 N3-methylase RlmH